MITSTSINAAFIAKLVHAANVAVACQSYCEILNSKGKPSVLVEWDVSTSSLIFTHASGQDVTSICWQAIEHMVCMPSVELVPVAEIIGQEDAGPSSYGFLLAYLLFVMLGMLAALGVLSWGAALINFGFAIAVYRLMPLLDRESYTSSADAYSELVAQ